ncbi:LOW QUALITY PROTEIN: hypothetical protein MC885_007176, partial [Smutsia gigantea]
ILSRLGWRFKTGLSAHLCGKGVLHRYPAQGHAAKERQFPERSQVADSQCFAPQSPGYAIKTRFPALSLNVHGRRGVHPREMVHAPIHPQKRPPETPAPSPRSRGRPATARSPSRELHGRGLEVTAKGAARSSEGLREAGASRGLPEQER